MQLFNGDRKAVYAFATESWKPIDVHKETKRSGRILLEAKTRDVAEFPPPGGGDWSYMPDQGPAQTKVQETMTIDGSDMRDAGLTSGQSMDFKTWLPFAAPDYHVSPDIKDYVMVPVIIMPTDLPNRNGVAFPLKELVRFHPSLGRQAYKTWKGKPTHLDHKNDDITKAYGIIADSSLRKLYGFGGGQIWKVLTFLSFDRSKHPDIVARILSGDLNSYSMGAWINTYSCSFCQNEVGTKACSHLSKTKPGEMYQKDNQLVFRNCVGIEGFETSAVETPAYISAISDEVSELG